MNENGKFALVPKTPAALEKAEPGAKRVLSGMVVDTLALVKKEQARKTRPQKIVIVDDADGTRSIYKLLLKNWFKGAMLQEFENGDDAWKELSQTDPELLITRIPVSGRFLLPLLAERMVKYPIFVTSSFFSEEEVREHAGPSLNVSFLPLPFTAQQFYQELLIHFGPSDNPQAQVLLKSHPVSILFSAEHIIPNLKSKERFGAIREMIAHLIYIGRIRPQDEEAVVDAINKRETSMSTGIGFGFAVPRGRVDCVKDIILAVGVSASGVEFDALDEQTVY